MRGKAQKSLALIAAAKEILEQIKPATVRAVCYLLFTRKLIPNMSKGSVAMVGEQLVYAREEEIIPWSWITARAIRTGGRGTSRRRDVLLALIAQGALASASCPGCDLVLGLPLLGCLEPLVETIFLVPETY